MKLIKRFSVCLALSIGAAVSAVTWSDSHGESLDEARGLLARDAVFADDARRAEAIAELRALGPGGLAALWREHEQMIKGLREQSEFFGRCGVGETEDTQTRERESALLRLRSALDGVAQARDTHACGLYWYTDLEAAKTAAAGAGKPILSLRLLGDLDEELSCANSRFFRTALYANESVSTYLRDNYILHWKSVRPVPRVTIDFGDGRKLERTLTGNSIHYVLDPNGRVVDAVPGLYGPGAFLRVLRNAESNARRAMTEAERANFARQNAAAIAIAWRSDLNRIAASEVAAPALAAPPTGGSPHALVAAEEARGKVMVEGPTLRAIFPSAGEAPAGANPHALEAAPLAVAKVSAESRTLRAMFPGGDTSPAAANDAVWKRIAALHRDDAQLDDSSLRLMREKSELLMECSRRGIAQPAMVTNFTDSIALDTVQNEYRFRGRICEWLAAGAADVETLNERVYAELFLTPSADPWLGLLEQDVYSALSDDGVVK